MSTGSEPEMLVLLGLRLRSFAPADAVAETVGLGVEVADPVLAQLAERDLARFRDGRMTGWMLTPAGRVEGERRLAAELDATGTRDAVAAAYGRFLTINPSLLSVCTDWQLRTVGGEQVVNDHADADHDERVVAELAELDAAAQPIVAELAATLERFGAYGPRLASALAAVRAGDGDWFTKPTIDSYHTVWFELHENLLATLGIERSAELAPAGQEAT